MSVDRTCGIYIIRNVVSGRIYVGSARVMYRRWRNHRKELKAGRHHSKTLQSSWIKHGEEAFIFEVIEVVDDPDNLIEREQFWLDKMGSADPARGFNIRPVAGSQLGTKRSEESRKRMSEAAIKRDRSVYVRVAPPWNKGKKMSFEYCQRISDIQRGRKRKPHSPTTRAKIGDANRGNKSPFKGKPRDPEIIRKTVETKRGKRNARYGQAELPLS